MPPHPSDCVIRAAVPADAPDIARIYNHYVRETVVTFEEVEVSDGEMERRIADVIGGSLPWLVAEEHGELRGYAHATPWKSRSAYRFAVEVTIYLDPPVARRGLGSSLYGALLPELAARGFHAAMGGIALPNDASVAFHERFGFEKVAHFREVGYKFGRWIDVGYWQRLLRNPRPVDSGR
jgi:L-amino acid N-acyltransferase YncA